MENKVKAVAYVRVSTLLGQDTNHQLHGIRELASQRGYDLINVYSDEGLSGINEKRPGLIQLTNDVRRGKFTIVIIHSIDRLGRSTKHLLNLMEEFKRCNVSLISIREALDFSTPYGQLALTLLAAVSQLELQLTKERIRTALAVKKAVAQKTGNGWKCGRPPIGDEVIEAVLRLRERGYSIRQISAMLNNVSKSSVSRIIKIESQKHIKNN